MLSCHIISTHTINRSGPEQLLLALILRGRLNSRVVKGTALKAIYIRATPGLNSIDVTNKSD